MVKADAIIDMQEIEFLNGVRQKYNIKREDEVMADTLTLADALQTLKDTSDSLKQDLWGDFRGMAVSDNACSREEAMYLFSIVACLSGTLSDNATVYSVELPENIKLDNSQVLYIEGEYYKETNREINVHYREILNELRLVGFNFVYIPKVGEHYRSLSREDLHMLISFLYPSVSEIQMEHVAKQLTTLSTSDFCKTEIVGRMKIDGLAIFSLGIKNKIAANTEEEFTVSKNIEGVKLKARATGELSSKQLNLEATLRKATLVNGKPVTSTTDPTSGGSNSGNNGGGGGSLVDDPEGD